MDDALVYRFFIGDLPVMVAGEGTRLGVLVCTIIGFLVDLNRMGALLEGRRCFACCEWVIVAFSLIYVGAVVGCISRSIRVRWEGCRSFLDEGMAM